MDPVALLVANPIAAAVVAVVLIVLGIKNRDKIAAFFSTTGDKVDATNAKVAGDAANVADYIKQQFQTLLSDLGGIKDDIDASTLDLGTRALWHRYLKTLSDPADQDAATQAFQTLINLNSKLIPPAK